MSIFTNYICDQKSLVIFFSFAILSSFDAAGLIAGGVVTFGADTTGAVFIIEGFDDPFPCMLCIFDRE